MHYVPHHRNHREYLIRWKSIRTNVNRVGVSVENDLSKNKLFNVDQYEK